MKAILDEDAIKIAYAAALCDTRPILEHLAIGNSEVMAADGFMLARRSIQTEPKKGRVVLIKAKAILKAHKILGGDELVIEIQKGGKTATIKSNNDRTNCITVDVVAPLLQDGKFPKYKQLIPKSERKAYVCLQANMIAKMLKITGAESGRGIKLKVREPTTPVEIHSRNTDIYLMPYFMPEEE
jgi:DNA polymerase III sliding clamp (beta) subunit (PCNA family)